MGALATYHFAPTPRARMALLSEGVDPESIFVTGNTVVDALYWILGRPPSPEAQALLARIEGDQQKLILVTAHRRESFGEPFIEICQGLRAVVERNPEVVLVYPVHPNPNVREPVKRFLAGHERILLLEPLSYEPFVRLMQACYLVLTDSGGLQEEAPVLGKPVLVLRSRTERPEAVEAGVARLIGTSKERIVSEVERLLGDEDAYQKMAQAGSLFGDGHAAERIVRILLEGTSEEG